MLQQSRGPVLGELAVHHEQRLLGHRCLWPLGDVHVRAGEVESAEHALQILTFDLAVDRAPVDERLLGDLERAAEHLRVKFPG